MPMCGFNNEMLEGLKVFHKGLAENRINKDTKKDRERLGDN